MREAEKGELREKIAREEARLAELDRQREAAHVRLQTLQSRMVAIADGSLAENISSTSSSIPIPITTAEKLALFRRLFRGRDDVFPRLWVNEKKGTKGYAPTCFNEWVRGVCEKPRVKCGECPNQAFIPVEDQIILDHLQSPVVKGRKVTAFTNREERAVELDRHVPFLLESRLRELGAEFIPAANWQDNVVVDGRLHRPKPTVQRERGACDCAAAFAMRPHVPMMTLHLSGSRPAAPVC